MAIFSLADKREVAETHSNTFVVLRLTCDHASLLPDHGFFGDREVSV